MLQALSRFNPEFQRNLWKQFSLHRLIAMPLILAVIFYISNSSPVGKINTLPEVAVYLMLLLLVVWGTGLSADAIFEEIQDHTWETQRMTPLGAWSMAWGKLFGSTSYVWYGAIFAAVAFFIGQSLNFQFLTQSSNTQLFPQNLLPFPRRFLFDFIFCILTGISAQAFAFFCALLVQRISPIRSRMRVTLIQIFAIFVFLSLYVVGKSILPDVYSEHSWYHLNIPYSIFVISSQLFVLAWLLIGIYRLLRVELQVKTAPWVWPLFVISWVLYCLGYVSLSSQLFNHKIPSEIANAWNWGVAFFIILNLTFLAAFFAPKNIIHAYRWVSNLKQRDYTNAFIITPAWILSGIVACIALIPFVTYSLQGSTIEGKMFSLQLTGFAFSMILFLLRDIGILYFLCWNPKAKRAHLATVMYLILLYILVPMLLSLLGLSSYWLPAFSPTAWFTQKSINSSQILSVNFVICLEVALALYGIAYRCRQNQIKSTI